MKIFIIKVLGERNFINPIMIGLFIALYRWGFIIYQKNYYFFKNLFTAVVTKGEEISAF